MSVYVNLWKLNVLTFLANNSLLILIFKASCLWKYMYTVYWKWNNISESGYMPVAIQHFTSVMYKLLHLSLNCSCVHNRLWETLWLTYSHLKEWTLLNVVLDGFSAGVVNEFQETCWWDGAAWCSSAWGVRLSCRELPCRSDWTLCARAPLLAHLAGQGQHGTYSADPGHDPLGGEVWVWWWLPEKTGGKHGESLWC